MARALVQKVEIYDEEIRISGSKEVLSSVLFSLLPSIHLYLVLCASGAEKTKRNFNAITAMICACAANHEMAACRIICYSAVISYIKSA